MSDPINITLLPLGQDAESDLTWCCDIIADVVYWYTRMLE